MRSARLATILLAGGLTGCAIHPDTQDFSRDMMADIVFHVQCEAQRAIHEALEDEKLYPALTLLHQKDPYAFGPSRSYDRYVQGFRTHLLNTGLNLKFEFALTENDDLTSDGSVKIPISLGSFTIGWDVGAEKERKSTQTVEFANTFNELTMLDCSPESRRRNFAYPITGNVGLQHTFDNFVRISARQIGFDELTFSDALKFKTHLRGKLSPSISLVPKAGRLVNVNVNAHVKRTDQHDLTLVFSQYYTPKQLSEKKAKDDSEAAKLLKSEIELAVAIALQTGKVPKRVQLVNGGNTGVIVPADPPPAPQPPSRAQKGAARERGTGPEINQVAPTPNLNFPGTTPTQIAPAFRTERFGPGDAPLIPGTPRGRSVISDPGQAAKRAAREEARRLERLNLNRRILEEIRR